MNSRSIARWLAQIGLPQYTSALEKQYYGLEGLLSVTEDDLRLMGVEDPEHRATILMQLQTQQPERENISAGTLSRKYGSSTDFFRHSIVPRLRRRDNRVSASCLQLRDVDHAPSSKLKLRSFLRKTFQDFPPHNGLQWEPTAEGPDQCSFRGRASEALIPEE